METETTKRNERLMNICDAENQRLAVYPDIKVSLALSAHKECFLLYESADKETALAVYFKEDGKIDRITSKGVGESKQDGKFHLYRKYELEHLPDKPYIFNGNLPTCAGVGINQSLSGRGWFDVEGKWLSKWLEENYNGPRTLYVVNDGFGYSYSPHLVFDYKERPPLESRLYEETKVYEYEYMLRQKYSKYDTRFRDMNLGEEPNKEYDTCVPTETRTLNVTVQCMALYNSSIEVPANLSEEEAIAYAKEHIREIPLGEMEYVSDSDELDEENCYFDEEEKIEEEAER